MATKAQIEAAKRNIKKAQKARWRGHKARGKHRVWVDHKKKVNVYRY